jgi:hypothetical protein
MAYSPRMRGMSLLETIFGIALFSLAFWGIFGVLKLSIELVASTKAKTGALALASEQIEFLRSLSYDAVATVGGIPAGSIPQLEIITLNDTTYTRRTFVQYVDAPEDGLGASDETGITADYKKVKVELTWSIKDRPGSLALVTTIVPKGIESLTGGGTLWVNAIDAFNQPLSGASVRVVNSTVSPSIDVTTFSNASGIVIFPGAPAGSNYEITVTRSGYSTAQTYGATVANPNPVPAHLSVLDAQTTSSTFAIDELGSITVNTFEAPFEELWEDDFLDGTKIDTFASTTISGGSLVLTENGGTYDPLGTVTSVTVAPTYVSSWGALTVASSTASSTGVSVRIWYESSPGTFSLVPESDLPGNSAGFASSTIDLSALSIVSYGALRFEGTLTTLNTSYTPSLDSWNVSYLRGPVPIADVNFDLVGTKTIGTDASALPIYKYSASHVTNSVGSTTLTDMEWDTYTLTETEPSIEIRSACPALLELSPDEDMLVTLFLEPPASDSLLVRVEDDAGNAIAGATVSLSRSGGYSTSGTADTCGQKLFADLVSASDYDVTVSASGFSPETLTNINVTQNTIVTVPLSPL